MSLLRCRTLAVLLGAVQLGACAASWQPSIQGPRELIEQDPPAHIRVTRTDSSRVEVSRPLIVNDSIATPTEECRTSVAGGGRYGCTTGAPAALVALTDVAGIEVRRRNPAGIVGLAVLAGLFIAVVDAWANWDVSLK